MTDTNPDMRPNIHEVTEQLNEIRNFYCLEKFIENFDTILQKNPTAKIIKADQHQNITLPYTFIQRQSTKHPNELRWEVVKNNVNIRTNKTEIFFTVGAIRNRNNQWIFKPKSKNIRQCKSQNAAILTGPQLMRSVDAERAVGQTHLKMPLILDNALITIRHHLPGEDLLTSIANNEPTNADYLDTCFSLIFQVIEATKNIHDSNVIHKDIKPENLIHDKSKNTCTAIDFEYASVEGVVGLTGCGTPGYAAPEVYTNAALTKAADIYSLALTIAAILDMMHKANWSLAQHRQFAEHPVFDKLSDTLGHVLPEHIIKDIQTTLHDMTVRDPKKRLSIDDVKAKFTLIKAIYDQHQKQGENKKRKNHSNANSFFDATNKKTREHHDVSIKNRLTYHHTSF